MADWIDRVAGSLRANGSEAQEWKVGHGHLLLSIPTARIIGCALPGVAGNLFWHHAALEDPASATTQLRQAGGGIGGDRLWIAPEVGYIFTDLKKARRDPITHSALPPAMDPAEWRIVESSTGHLRLSTEMRLRDHRTGRRIALRVDRQFDAAGPAPGLPPGLKGASFAIRNTATLLEADPGAVAGVWDLLQLPPTGWLICPTVGRATPPRRYYNPFGPRHVQCRAGAVRFLIDGKHRIKMGIDPLRTAGRMGYYRKVGRTSTLVFRAFAPLPGQPYVDVPRSSSALFGGDALQAYNDGGAFGGFGEMEYHDPALVAGRGPDTRTGESITHVLAGPDAAIRKAGAMLLGVKL